jgi:glycosyltransferase involved in cell wall biosynthesis
VTPSPRFLWFGPAYDPSGHADELRGFLRAQELSGDEPALRNLSWTDRRAEVSPADAERLERQRVRGTTRHHDVVVHTVLPGGSPHVEGAMNVARAMFETDRMPARWLEPLLRRDQVWVPCRLNYEAFADSGVPEHRLRIVGGTLDFGLFDPTVAPYPLATEPGRRVFLTNFDFSARKGWETLLRAWGAAFDADDPVCLVLKTGSFYRDDGWVRERITGFLRDELGTVAGGLAPIHLFTDLLAGGDMPGLYAAADAYVLASRGEGWGRPYMEAQAMGLPTIASRWGGQREFMDEDTGWLVDGRLVDVPDDADLFNDLYAGHRWFEPDADDLAARLREVAADWDAARARVAPARGRLIDRFGTQATAARLRTLAGELMQRPTSVARACVIRGRFGATESLATVNDGLAASLERSGWMVGLRTPGSGAVAAPAPSISHSWPHDFTPGTDGPSVVVMPWEYGAPPAAWVRDARRHADRVWVPSAYVRDRFVAAGMPPGIVDVVPNGVDPARFSPDGPARELPVSAACTFLYVGGSIWRKGIDVLVRAWEEAFGPGDDVALVIKDFGASTWYRDQNAGRELRRFAARRDIAPVAYLDADVPARELGDLYRAADVLVAPYRGEGFGMPALEAMACGLAVIHTATGPTGEFVTPQAGWAVRARQVPMADISHLPPLAGEAHVQEPDHDALVVALRAATDPVQRARCADAARAAAADHTWDAVAHIAERSLRTLAAEGLAPVRHAVPERVDAPAGNAVVLYAPRWEDERRWAATLTAWAEIVAVDDPVTLVLPAAGEDPERLVERILARLAADGLDLEALPDLLMCGAQTTPADVLVAADAVLLDPGDAGRPELTRRAPRVVHAAPQALRALRAELAGEPVLA